MTVDQAIAVVIDSLSGARYAEGMAALLVIRSHIEREVVSRERVDACLKRIDEAATNHSPYECGLPLYDLAFMDTARDAIIAALEVDRA